MHTHRIHSVLAAGTFLTFGFASAIAVGAVPQDHHSGPRPAAASLAAHRAALGHVARPTAAHTRHHAVKAAVVTTKHHAAAKHHKVSPAVATSTAPAPAAQPTQAAAPRRHHHTTRPATPTKTPTTPAKARLAPRTTPSSSAVQAAIQGLKKYVHSFLTPTAAQVGQFGDMVCTAYDDGHTTAQIESDILRKVQSLPLTTVLPGAADYVVRTAVTLYCPGYKSRLGSAAA